MTLSALWLVLALWTCLCQRVASDPCPPTALFMFSEYHNAAFCVCDRQTTCVSAASSTPSSIQKEGRQSQDDQCTRGHPSNPNSFRLNDFGFPATCLDCSCVEEGKTPEDYFKLSRIITYKKDGISLRDYADPVLQGRCQAVGDAMRAPSPLRNISWVHFPKCGTSFTSVMYNYVCQNTTDAHVFKSRMDPGLSLYMPTTCQFCYKTCMGRPSECRGFSFWAPHDGLIRARRTAKPIVAKQCVSNLMGVVNVHYPLLSRDIINGISVAAMFRNPLTRLMSAYNHARHSFGMPNRPTMLETTQNWTLKEWAYHPHIQGCQTKMLVGTHCASSRKLSLGDLQLAKNRLRGLAYVGLVEDWEQAICLFHRQFGGKAHEHEFLNLRPANTSKYSNKFRMASIEDLKLLKPEDEPMDYPLFQAAKTIYMERLKEYGLEVKDWMKQLDNIYDIPPSRLGE